MNDYYSSQIIYHSSFINYNIVAKLNQNKQKKLTFMDIIKGNFLNRDEVKAHYKYFVFIFGLLMVMIYSNHLVNKKIEHVNKLKEETEEYKSRNAYAQSRLIKIRMESELGKEMVQDSLVSLESHPMKLLIKVDSTDDKATK